MHLFALVLSAAPVLSEDLRTPQRAAPLRDAGVLHLDTGTWMRRAHSQAALGPDVLYDNTCPTGYYTPFEDTTIVDEGRLPSPGSPPPTGCATSYRIDGFRFGYCTDQSAASFGTYTHRFYASYSPCGSITSLVPVATIPLTGLPASPNGVTTCWTVTIDLGASQSFEMPADGDGAYQGSSTSDRFGWAMSSTAPGILTGPLISGDPAACGPGAGTYFSALPAPGTGLGNRDAFRITEVPPGSPSYLDACHYFGGTPFAGFDLRLLGTACATSGSPGLDFCLGDGGGTTCPCGNHSPTAAAVGCLNSLGVGGALRAFGTASLANDSLVLIGSNLPSAPCLFFQGTLRQNGGLGTPFGDGLRCAGGEVVRLGAQAPTSSGPVQHPHSGGASISTQGAVTSPGTRTYQVWYRNTISFCTPAGFNLTNGVEVSWGT